MKFSFEVENKIVTIDIENKIEKKIENKIEREESKTISKTTLKELIDIYGEIIQGKKMVKCKKCQSYISKYNFRRHLKNCVKNIN